MLCLSSALSFAAGQVKLEPNAILRFDFPELSPNMATMFTTQTSPNILLAQLPANYMPQRKFPIVIYLDGGNGGLVLSTKRLRDAMGPDNYICVRLPLFKAAKIKTDPVGGLFILPKDYAVISKNYRIMLQKLFDTVPNITPEGSTLGGFSNGAHTTAILLEAADEFILKHFTHFYLVEGGAQLRGATLQNEKLKDRHFLMMLGDRGRAANPFEGSGFASGILATAKVAKLDFTTIPMRGYGHEMPFDYLRLMGCWTSGKPLPAVPPKSLSSGNTPPQIQAER